MSSLVYYTESVAEGAQKQTVWPIEDVLLLKTQ